MTKEDIIPWLGKLIELVYRTKLGERAEITGVIHSVNESGVMFDLNDEKLLIPINYERIIDITPTGTTKEEV